MAIIMKEFNLMWKKVKSDYYKNFGKEISTFPRENEVYEFRDNNKISYLVFSTSPPTFLLRACKEVETITVWKNI